MANTIDIVETVVSYAFKNSTNNRPNDLSVPMNKNISRKQAKTNQRGMDVNMKVKLTMPHVK